MADTEIVFPNGRFGDCRVVQLLGRGGMGAVYLIQDDQGRSFAAKILLPEDDGAESESAVARFVREAELAMAVRHPNLMHVYDVGRDPDTGYCYMIMDFASGGSLAQRIRETGVLPVPEALRIVRVMAGALQAIEASHVVHRDIKSDNILFTAAGVPVLTDLGIAHRTRQKSDSFSTLTMDGTMIGTPAYMAPEQAMNARTADIRADIYSLGVVLFEMLTGRLPYADCSTMETLARLMRGVPVPDVRTLRSTLPDGVATLVRRMCAPRKALRLQNTAQLFALLDCLECDGNFKPNEAPLPVRKRQGVKIAVVAVLAAILIGGFAGGVHLAKKMGANGGDLPTQTAASVRAPIASALPDDSDLEDIDELSLVAAKAAVSASRQPHAVARPVAQAPAAQASAPVRVVSRPLESVAAKAEQPGRARAEEPDPPKTPPPVPAAVEPVAEPDPDELWDYCLEFVDLQKKDDATPKVLAAVNAAREHDPDFRSFDLKGEAKDAALSEDDRIVVSRGKTFFVLERLRRETPDFVQRLVSAEKRLRAAGKLSTPTSQKDVAIILGEAAGKQLDALFKSVGVR